ncbi:MAG: MFS family permease [Colwellia sp.]|jgi:MFS family permease
MQNSVNDKSTLVTILALLVSLFAQMQAISLLGITIPLSLASNEISTNTVGQVMALYSIGLVIGSYQGKKTIARVGHIRAFAGFGAIAISAAVLHSLTHSVVFYALLRIVSGLSAAVMLIVIESWFNTLSQNANRSRLMALHQVVFYCAMGTGQLLINLIPSDFSATFLIAALLSCCAIIPITLIRIENPPVTINTPVKLSELIKIAPCGIVGAVCAGNAIGTVFNLAPIYAKNMQISTLDISIFMSAIIFSGVLLQNIIGKLADKYSRERILIFLLLITALASQLLLLLNTLVPLVFLGLLLGAPIACLYPVSVAATYAHLSDDKAVASSSTLMLAYAIGGFSGPIIASFSMTFFSPKALFIYLSMYCITGAVACFIIQKNT